jgi:drug/metabolite transporter (DMT)-like permease
VSKVFGWVSPFLFVLLWSTGFIGVKYGIPYSPPFTFVALRMLIAAPVLALIALIVNKRFEISRAIFIQSSAIGLTLHAAYLAGCFYAVSRGLPAGIVARIVSLQPVMVSVFAAVFLKEELSFRKIAGLMLGLLGLVIVLAPRITTTSDISWIALGGSVIALIGGTSGTILQKRYGNGLPVLSSTSIQYAMTAISVGILALATEKITVRWEPHFIFSLVWLIVVLSVGAILLLFYLLRDGSAASVSSYYYLVPPVTAIEAYFLFGEKVSIYGFIGTLITVIGVWLVVAKRSSGAQSL